MTHSGRTHAQARAQMRQGILTAGNEQLKNRGAANLSLREVARELSVVPSALYRHVANRDELLTLLLVDAYQDLAATVDAALANSEPPFGSELPTPAPAARLLTLAGTMREWAVSNPERWALLYGTPVPGYSAPGTQTTPPGTAVMLTFFGILAHGEAPAAPTLTPAFTELLTQAAHDFGIPASAHLTAAAIMAFSSLVGIISAEIFQQFGAQLASFGAEQLTNFAQDLAAQFHLE